MKIKVLYEDANILAIDKPSGILVHPAAEQARYGAGPDEKTILDIFKKKYPKLKIVHRLDRETSGVLLLAKNKKAHEFLKSQFKNREVKKIYMAIVSGNVKNDRGVINKPIGRSPKDFRRRLSGRGARGEMREAVTEYRVLERIHLPLRGRLGGGKLNSTSPQPLSKGEGVNFTYLEVRPKTGRTHQIRVHMKYLNHPVAGDSLYNPNGPLPNLPLIKGEEKGGGRMFLHAKSIEFRNLKGEIVKVESAIPEEFNKVVK
jgi:23S rRNA pseudouridine1911/1915/1917 synthase